MRKRSLERTSCANVRESLRTIELMRRVVKKEELLIVLALCDKESRYFVALANSSDRVPSRTAMLNPGLSSPTIKSISCLLPLLLIMIELASG